MSRRRPVCAFCGLPLRGAQIRIQLRGLPGAPEVGWHSDTDGVDRRRGALLRCAWEDALFDRLMSRNAEDSTLGEEVVRTIQTRGESRVSAGKKWHEYLRDVHARAKADVRAAKQRRGRM